RTPDHRPLRVCSNGAVPRRLVIRAPGAIASTGRRARRRIVTAGRNGRDPQLVGSHSACFRRPARKLTRWIRRPGDGVRADAVPRLTIQDAELVTVGDPDRVV